MEERFRQLIKRSMNSADLQFYELLMKQTVEQGKRPDEASLDYSYSEKLSFVRLHHNRLSIEEIADSLKSTTKEIEDIISANQVIYMNYYQREDSEFPENRYQIAERLDMLPRDVFHRYESLGFKLVQKVPKAEFIADTDPNLHYIYLHFGHKDIMQIADDLNISFLQISAIFKRKLFKRIKFYRYEDEGVERVETLYQIGHRFNYGKSKTRKWVTTGVEFEELSKEERAENPIYHLNILV